MLKKVSPQTIVAILGPTATGKSDLGVLLAKQFNGEIISADSRQVYRGMNIGTGKVTKKEMKGIEHHLIDVVSPKSSFNASKFKSRAQAKFSQLAKRNRLPLLVGGTGFWIDAALETIALSSAEPNPAFRKKLSSKSADELFKMLVKLDSNRAKNIDRYNKVRLIRAIEIAKWEQKHKKGADQSEKKNFSVLYLGLDLPTEKLYEKIDRRLEQRFRKGMIKEVALLHQNGLSWKKLEEFGLEYRYIARFLQNKISKEEMMIQLSFAIKHYAKRQRTWFKKNKNIIWLDPSKKTTVKKAAVLVKKFLKTNAS